MKIKSLILKALAAAAFVASVSVSCSEISFIDINPPADLQSKIDSIQALKDAMNAFLRALPTQTRQIFALRYGHFESVADIAKRLGISQSKVKMQLLRSREKLRAHLQKEGFLV